MTTYNSEAGRAAYVSVEALITSYGADEVNRRSCKLESAVVHVLSVAEFIETKSLKKHLAQLIRFDMQHVENLRPLAWAAWYCADQLASASTTKEGQRVDPSLLERAKERRERMIRVLSYHLGDNKKVAQELADLTSGTGYVDLAHDLGRLATLYETYVAEIERDTRHYRPEDAAEARADTQAIVQSLATPSKLVAHWQDQLHRAFTAMAEAYAEVRGAVHWLWRDDPVILASFKPLTSMARSSPRKRSKPADTATPEGRPEHVDQVPPGPS